MSAALLVGSGDEQGRCGVVDADECQDEPGRVVSGQFLIQHDLFGHGQATAPFAGPVRYGESRAVQFGEPGLLESDEFLLADAGLCLSPILRDVLFAPGPHGRAELGQIGAHAYRPVRPPPPTRRVSRSRVADNPSGSRRSGWLWRDSHDSVVSSQNPTAPCS